MAKKKRQHRKQQKHGQNQGQTATKAVEITEEKPQTWGRKCQALAIKTMSAMAQGLFASLLIGTMIGTLGSQLGIAFLVEIGDYAKGATGFAMAVAIGYSLSASPLVLFSLVTVGSVANSLGGAGGPFAVLVVSIITCWIGSLVSQKTKFDIIVTPMVTVVGGCLTAMLLAPTIGQCANSLGAAIIWATELQPFFMGILLSVVMGIALTLPISSAAICAGLGLTGLAGGAGLAGCCAQMVGFATMSYKENGVSGLFSQGLGTSMLQMSNIIKNPKIWIPPILTSAVTGPLATMFFKMEMNGAAVSSGMGTCGLVGQIGLYTGWVADVESGAKASISAFDWMGLFAISFVLPAILTPIFYGICKKMGYINEGDLTL